MTSPVRTITICSRQVPAGGVWLMLRVTTLYASSAAATAAYYTQYLAQAPGEVPGVWSGRQAAGLGLVGRGRRRRARRRCWRAVTQSSGTPLGSALRRPDTDERDGGAGGGGVRRDVLGAEVGDGVVGAHRRSRLLEAHDVAVRAALEHLERFGSTTRVGSTAAACTPTRTG